MGKILPILPKLFAPFQKKEMRKLKYSMFIQWSQEDNCFLVAFPDFPEDYWRTHGDTVECFGDGNYEVEFADSKAALSFIKGVLDRWR